MTIQDWGALGEMVGGVAIIFSLIYVGVQIRQNTNTLRLSTAHNAAVDLSDIYLIPATHGDFADIFYRGLQDLDSLQGAEMVRFYGFFHKYFRSWEDAYYQFTHGALEAGPFAGITSQMLALAAMPGVRKYWRDRRSWYTPKFQDYVDKEISSAASGEFKLAGT